MFSVENITSGAILSFDVLCVGSPVTVNKQVQYKETREFKAQLGIIEKSM